LECMMWGQFFLGGLLNLVISSNLPTNPIHPSIHTYIHRLSILHLHCRYSMVERKAHCVWKGDQWNGYCSQDWILWKWARKAIWGNQDYCKWFLVNIDKQLGRNWIKWQRVMRIICNTIRRNRYCDVPSIYYSN
jgi:hypothetical protein